MSRSAVLKRPLQLLKEREELIECISDPGSLQIMRLLHARGPQQTRAIGAVVGLSAETVTGTLERLCCQKLVNPTARGWDLSVSGVRWMDYALLPEDYLVGTAVSGEGINPDGLPGCFTILGRIGMGATAWSFLAEQKATGTKCVIKVFRPGMVRWDAVRDAVMAAKDCRTQRAALPVIMDAGRIHLRLGGRDEITSCVAMHYIDGGAVTFAEYLEEQENFDRYLLERLVEDVGGALRELERVKLSHNDLHEGNILVVSDQVSAGSRVFWVIDYIGFPSPSPHLTLYPDLESFRDRLLQCVRVACRKYPGYSGDHVIGPKVSRVLSGLKVGKYSTFAQLMEDYQENPTPVPQDYFKSAESMSLTERAEAMSPVVLLRLFEPESVRYDLVRRFENTCLSGPRGCGKSHYLRALAFHASLIADGQENPAIRDKLRKLRYDHRQIFGVLFNCRLGEFKAFTPEAVPDGLFTYAVRGRLKHVLIVKIIARTLRAVLDGLNTSPEFGGPADLSPLHRCLESQLGQIPLLTASETGDVLRQLLAVSIAAENTSIASWNEPDAGWNPPHLLAEPDLATFFASLKDSFKDLARTRFYILVDDVTHGNVHNEMQKILNCLVRAVSKDHCFKVTCEKFQYTLETADGPPLDPQHELRYVDLGEVSAKTQRQPKIDLSDYLARVVDARLRELDCQVGIQTLLGQSQKATEFLSALSERGSHRSTRESLRGAQATRAYYGGWNIVWSICHGSVRTLLDLVDAILSESGSVREVTSIPLAIQDKAVRSFADSRLKALAVLPGEFRSQDARLEPMGEHLQKVMNAIGFISRLYLRSYRTGSDERWYETITLERLDLGPLREAAAQVLAELVDHGLLMADGMSFSRGQFGLCRRYDMNKVLSPAYETTYRVRNHMYLRSERLEELLTEPDKFASFHRNKLELLATRDQSPPQARLFT